MNTAPMNQRNIYFETLREQLQTVKIIKGSTKIDKSTYKLQIFYLSKKKKKPGIFMPGCFIQQRFLYSPTTSNSTSVWLPLPKSITAL